MIPAEERSRLPVTFLVGIVIVLAHYWRGAVLYSRYSTPAVRRRTSLFPWGPRNRPTYRKFICSNPKMSRAANFLNQEVTYIFGTVENGGNRKVKQIEITLEFHDPFRSSRFARQAAPVSSRRAADDAGRTERFSGSLRTHFRPVEQRLSDDQGHRGSSELASRL